MSQVGCRTDDLTVHSGDFKTSHDGQIIERLQIDGRLIVKHDDVTFRDCKVFYTTNYGLDNRDDHQNVVCEWVEFNGANLPSSDNRGAGHSGYAGFGYTLRHVLLRNATMGFISYGGTVVEDSWLQCDTDTDQDSPHREPLLLRGSNHKVVRSYVVCDVPRGCSAAVAVYGSPNPVHNVLLQHNLVGGQCGYCVYGGSSHNQEDTSNIRIIENGFDGSFVEPFNICGRAGDITAFDSSDPGNEFVGNFRWPSMEPI